MTTTFLRDKEVFGGSFQVKHFLAFLIFIFFGLGLSWHLKTKKNANLSEVTRLKVFATSSFSSAWGPGPSLKSEFEKSCNCIVEYFDSQENAILFQRLKSQKENSIADVILSLDQHDLQQAKNQIQWKDLSSIYEKKASDFSQQVLPFVSDTNFLPYDFSPISFVYDSKVTSTPPASLDDLLKPEFKGQIVIPDPRLSSVGFQFLNWLIQTKGKSDAFIFLEKLNTQIKAYPPSWSSSYSLFSKGEARLALSYLTSPLYHEIEEKKSNIKAAIFVEGHPLQIEYMGIPESCAACEKGLQFIEFVLSPEAQKIIMEKNYMLPAVSKVSDNTLFSQIPNYSALNFITPPSIDERIEILERWIALRR